MVFGLPRNKRFIVQEDLGILSNFSIHFDMNDEGQKLQVKITQLKLTPNNKEKSCCHLGVQFDNKLTFRSHFDLEPVKFYSQLR